jgi:phage shock protein C
MFCTQCGAQLADSARFCTSCGKPTGGGQPAAESSTRATTSLSTTAPSTTAPRKLRRIVSRKKIAGVCAGFAEYFDADITLMRVIWVALLLLPPHLGLIAYIVAWAVLPKS